MPLGQCLDFFRFARCRRGYSPKCSQSQHVQYIRLATQIIHRRDSPKLAQPGGEETAIRIAGLFFLKQFQSGLFQSGGIFVMKMIRGKTADYRQIGLAIRIPYAGIAADPQKTSVRRNTAFHQLPEFPDMPVEFRRRRFLQRHAIVMDKIQRRRHFPRCCGPTRASFGVHPHVV